jgi:hypothetical protein
MFRSYTAALAAAGLIAVAACGDSKVSPTELASSTAVSLSAQTPQSIVGVVGQSATAAPAAIVTGSRGNPIGGASVVVVSSTGDSTTLTSDASGVVRASWTFGTTKGTQTLTMRAGTVSVVFTAAVAAGPAVQIRPLSDVSGQAGSVLTNAQVLVADQYGNGVGGVTVSFAVAAGAGRLASPSAITADDGTVTVPAWTLGTSVAPQRVRATSGTMAADVSATIATDYDIDVRFFGAEMSAAHKALFNNAAARIEAIIVGDVTNALINGINASTYCGLTGLPVLSETIDDLVIFAAVQPIDGAGRVLARAGPCAMRDVLSGSLPLFGVMEFDSADLASLDAQGRLQDVIMHEMMHVIGLGTMWPTKNLLTGSNTSTVAYTGTGGLRGCGDTGGLSICASAVPVENTGGAGTANAHWRESVFATELMTGYANNAAMPISLITTGGLQDLGYSVNHLAADVFRVPSAASFSVAPGSTEVWETGLPVAPRTIGSR